MSRECKNHRYQIAPGGIKHGLLDCLLFPYFGFRLHYLHARILRGVGTYGPICAGELFKRIETGVKICRMSDFIRELKAVNLIGHKESEKTRGRPLHLLILTQAGEAIYKASRKPKAPAAES